MTGKEIVEKARGFASFRYWYGGKREIATKALADRLKKENPGVWTETYYSRALKDIDGATRVCDCSGLVCACYGIKDVGSYQIAEKFKKWTGTPRAGMIAWKKGHVGIFLSDGWGAKIAEMRSQAYDYQETRTFADCGFTSVLYDPAVTYGEEKDDGTAVGWHKDGTGWWYRHTKGTGAATYYHDVFEEINGRKYCFDSSGYICTLIRVRPDSNGGWL